MENKDNNHPIENAETESPKSVAPTKVANPETEKKLSKNKSNKTKK